MTELQKKYLETKVQLILDKDYEDVYYNTEFIFSFSFSKQIPEKEQRELAEFYIKKINQCDKNNPKLNDILENLEAYRKQIFETKTVSATEFQHMQTALHWAKNIVRDCYNVKREGDTAWVKN